uniref:Uncharacterized protein n=1 Tax=viral metagenome TaxID=1070528 RepID=A0A6C0EUL1_9ZZZZ
MEMLVLIMVPCMEFRTWHSILTWDIAREFGDIQIMAEV